MKTVPSDELEHLVRLVQESTKYAAISPDLIRSLGAQELNKRSDLKQAVKSTRSKLHQVGSAYQEKAIPYPSLLNDLADLNNPLSDPSMLEVLKRFMTFHTSSRERLPILDRIFSEALAPIAPVKSILDIACGFNPLAIPWMPLAPDFTYQALDIYTPMIVFLNAFFSKFKINGRAEVIDVLEHLPQQPVHLAMLLKTIPCLEQIDKQAGRRLLENISAENLLVSFPAHSLGGRPKGMVQNYEAHFRELTARQPWKITRFEFPGELVFLVQKT